MTDKMQESAELSNLIVKHPKIQKILESAAAYDALLEQTRGKCSNCKGTGLNPANCSGVECFVCHGTGSVVDPKRIVVLKGKTERLECEHTHLDDGRVFKHSHKSGNIPHGHHGSRYAGFKKVLPGNNEGEK